MTRATQPLVKPGAPAGFSRLDEQLCLALYQASRAVIRAYGPLLEPLGLTYLQYLTLLALWEEDDVAVKRLGERLELDSATLTPVLKRLERQGLVARARDASDERVVRIRLTPAGVKLRARTRGIPWQLACRMAATTDPTAIARLATLREELKALSARVAGSG